MSSERIAMFSQREERAQLRGLIGSASPSMSTRICPWSCFSLSEVVGDPLLASEVCIGGFEIEPSCSAIGSVGEDEEGAWQSSISADSFSLLLTCFPFRSRHSRSTFLPICLYWTSDHITCQWFTQPALYYLHELSQGICVGCQ